MLNHISGGGVKERPRVLYTRLYKYPYKPIVCMREGKVGKDQLSHWTNEVDRKWTRSGPVHWSGSGPGLDHLLRSTVTSGPAPLPSGPLRSTSVTRPRGVRTMTESARLKAFDSSSVHCTQT